MRFTTKAASFAVALATSAALAGAQTTVAGTTSGCFGTGCTPTGPNATYTVPGSTGGAINFAGSAFTGMTNPATGAFSVSDFGTFQTAGFGGSNFSTPFTLLFSLSAPVGSTSPSAFFTVSGNLGANSQTRDVAYTFSGTPVTFTYPGGSGSIQLDNGFIGANNSATITGRVLASSVVPEPSTYAMMGMGLAGLVAAARRRRSA